jgi:hypothetical protein
MSDATKNHEYLRLAAKILGVLLTSGAVAKWIDGDLPQVATQNEVRSQAGEASLIILLEEQWKLKQRVEELEKR